MSEKTERTKPVKPDENSEPAVTPIVEQPAVVPVVVPVAEPAIAGLLETDCKVCGYGPRHDHEGKKICPIASSKCPRK